MVRKFLKNIYAKIALHGKQLQLTQLCSNLSFWKWELASGVGGKNEYMKSKNMHHSNLFGLVHKQYQLSFSCHEWLSTNRLWRFQTLCPLSKHPVKNHVVMASPPSNTVEKKFITYGYSLLQLCKLLFRLEIRNLHSERNLCYHHYTKTATKVFKSQCFPRVFNTTYLKPQHGIIVSYHANKLKTWES